MSSDLEKAIIDTLCYADIFDYPLTSEEIWRYLIKDRTCSQKMVDFSLSKLKNVNKLKNLYCLQGRNKLFALRTKRERRSNSKFETAQRIAGFLKIIPTVKLVGITGTLAVDNADEEDDIDLIIVAENKRLWITRFFATLLVEFTGLRRRPTEKNVRDKICLNMFLDENSLSIPANERDLYIAHEVVQLKPIYNRNFTYEKFIYENRWVVAYLPNSLKNTMKQSGIHAIKQLRNQAIEKLSDQTIKRCSYQSFISLLLCKAETLLRKFQLWYMRKKITNEITGIGVIRFHPKNSGKRILRKYYKRLELYTP